MPSRAQPSLRQVHAAESEGCRHCGDSRPTYLIGRWEHLSGNGDSTKEDRGEKKRWGSIKR